MSKNDISNLVRKIDSPTELSLYFNSDPTESLARLPKEAPCLVEDDNCISYASERLVPSVVSIKPSSGFFNFVARVRFDEPAGNEQHME